ncbi:hypothetical protein AURDEDRAFT_126209 [Auricularia subglabra TFB-10046 SS5]|nr:hypothetical protein AURDEDRAFT_126209 [Auricularia subglabra TFB-10046 SS5]
MSDELVQEAIIRHARRVVNGGARTPRRRSRKAGRRSEGNDAAPLGRRPWEVVRGRPAHWRGRTTTRGREEPIVVVVRARSTRDRSWGRGADGPTASEHNVRMGRGRRRVVVDMADDGAAMVERGFHSDSNVVARRENRDTGRRAGDVAQLKRAVVDVVVRELDGGWLRWLRVGGCLSGLLGLGCRRLAGEEEAEAIDLWSKLRAGRVEPIIVTAKMRLDGRPNGVKEQRGLGIVVRQARTAYICDEDEDARCEAGLGWRTSAPARFGIGGRVEGGRGQSATRGRKSRSRGYRGPRYGRNYANGRRGGYPRADRTASKDVGRGSMSLGALDALSIGRLLRRAGKSGSEEIDGRGR